MPGGSVLITGCSTGIGYDAAHGLKARGWRVFATCRKQEDCDRLNAEGLESFVLDQTDPQSIRAALHEAVNRNDGRLDALFINGAYGLPAAAEDLPTDAMRAIFETNFFGVHELTRQAIPFLRRQKGGRIVYTSSVLGLSALSWRAAYVATKHALEGYADTLRLELAPANIQVVLIEPGPITSAFRINSRGHFERWIDWRNSPWKDAYEAKLLPRLYDNSERRDAFELGPRAVTRKLIRALESPRPRQRYFVTLPTYVAAWGRRFLPARLADWLTARV